MFTFRYILIFSSMLQYYGHFDVQSHSKIKKNIRQTGDLLRSDNRCPWRHAIQELLSRDSQSWISSIIDRNNLASKNLTYKFSCEIGVSLRLSRPFPLKHSSTLTEAIRNKASVCQSQIIVSVEGHLLLIKGQIVQSQKWL